jgi:oxygen-independent coproporphyrinogen-3 oxidase
MGLMCDRRLDFAALSAALRVDVAKEYAKEIAGLADLQADGLLVCTADGIEVLARGVPLLRVIAMRFDATFVPGPGRHAQTV